MVGGLLTHPLTDGALPACLLVVIDQSFIKRYLGPFFGDNEFRVVKTGFHLFNLLLQYHDPGKT